MFSQAMGGKADLRADGADRGPLAVHCAPHRGLYRHGPRPADGQLPHALWRETLCRQDPGPFDVARDGTGADRPYDRGTRRGRDHSGTWLDAGHRANRRHAFLGNQPGPETGLAPAGGHMIMLPLLTVLADFVGVMGVLFIS